MASMTNRTLGPSPLGMATLASLVARISAWNDARVTRKYLSKLSLRELDDLGLMRADIEDIAQGRFRR